MCKPLAILLVTGGSSATWFLKAVKNSNWEIEAPSYVKKKKEGDGWEGFNIWSKDKIVKMERRKLDSALAGVAQWIECCPANWKVASSIPGYGTRLDWAQAKLPSLGVGETTNQYFSQTWMFLYLSFSLSSPLSQNK